MTLRLRIAMSFVIGIGVLLTGCGESLNGQPRRAGVKTTLVAQQEQFCQIIQNGDKEVDRLGNQRKNEQNPLRKDALEKEQHLAEDKMFDTLYALAAPSGAFAGWRGRVSFNRPDDKGRIKVGFNSACQFPASSGILSLSMSTPTADAIELASPLGQVLSTLDPSKDVIVTGTFLFAQKGGGYWPSHMHYIDTRHFLPNEGMALPSLGEIVVSVRLTSIAQAR